MKTLQEHINEVMDWFDFNSVKLVMNHLKWTWNDNSVPEIPEMRQLVRELMTKLYDKCKNYKAVTKVTTGTGGFTIRYSKGIDKGEPWDHFEVAFELETWYTGE